MHAQQMAEILPSQWVAPAVYVGLENKLLELHTLHSPHLIATTIATANHSIGRRKFTRFNGAHHILCDIAYEYGIAFEATLSYLR